MEPEPKPATNQFRASLKAEFLKAEFESTRRALRPYF